MVGFSGPWALKLLRIPDEEEEPRADQLDLVGMDASRIEVMNRMGIEWLGTGTPRFDVAHRTGIELAQLLVRRMEESFSPKSDEDPWQAQLAPALVVLVEILREAVDASDDRPRMARSLVDFSGYLVLKLLGVAGGEA